LRKLYVYRIFLAFLIVSALIFSCKSAPKAAPEPEVEEEIVVVEEIVEEIPEIIETAPIVEVIVPETAPMEADSGFIRRQEIYDELGYILVAAQAKRQELIDNGFYEESPQAFGVADNALNHAVEDYVAGIDAVGENSLVNARMALEGFTAIIDSVWLSRVDAQRVKSANAQQQALKLKADMAVKDRYALAAELHNKGDAALRGKDYAAAIGFYEEALPVFDEAIKIAAEKKEKAELALKNAEQKIAESEKIAEDAVKFIENSSTENGEIL
jgi:tetratricopeptide (TPR) repeat protein